MPSSLPAFLDALYAAGVAHDAAQPDRLRKRRNLEPAAAALLAMLVRVARARRVVEIGTSNGLSTTCLADAVLDTEGRLVSVDVAPPDEARATLAAADSLRGGLAGCVEFVQADGGRYLSRLDDGTVDLLFLDAERREYPGWWPHPVRVVRAGGVLAIDNVRSHADEVQPFLDLLAREAAFIGTTVDVGKGLHVAWRRGDPAREPGG